LGNNLPCYGRHTDARAHVYAKVLNDAIGFGKASNASSDL